MRELIDETPKLATPRLVLASLYKSTGNQEEARIYYLTGCLLAPSDAADLLVIDAKDIPNLADGIVDPDTGETVEFSELNLAASYLFALEDASVTTRLVYGSMDRGNHSWVYEQLTKQHFPPVGAPSLIRLANSLHTVGEIRRTTLLLRGYYTTGNSQSPQLTRLHEKRERELQMLDYGPTLIPPPMLTPQTRGVNSLYLLHNSLPYQSGGYATRTHGLLTGLNLGGHQVVGVTRPGFPATRGAFNQQPNLTPFDVIDGVEYHRLIGEVTTMPRGDLQGFVNRYCELLQPIVAQFQPQIIHAASNWWNGHAATMAAQSLGIPSIYEVRGLWEVTRASRNPSWASTETYQLEVRYETHAALQADHVIAITAGLKRELVRRGVSADKISIVPNGVDAERFANIERDEDLKTELGLAGRCILGFVGSITFYEGLISLLDAVAVMRTLTKTPLGVIFVGDGPVTGELMEHTTALGLDDVVRFVGRVPHHEVERYLGIIDITPFPRESLPVCEMVSPLKPLESMAAGIPVVVSAVEALAEMIPSEEHGVVVPRGDVPALATALAELVDDPDRRAVLASNARTWVQSERNWSLLSQRVGDIYDDLTAS
jgi:glycosyltransferase involved in cell wall biosynthesis